MNCVQKENTTLLLPPKHVRLGVAAVVITNLKTGASTQVYAFHNSWFTTSLLRRSVADKLGHTGIKYILKCKGFMTSKDLQMESASIRVGGLEEKEEQLICDVGILWNVPISANLFHTCSMKKIKLRTSTLHTRPFLTEIVATYYSEQNRRHNTTHSRRQNSSPGCF